MKLVRVENDYPAPAANLWNLAKNYDALAEIMKGIASFDGLPTGDAKSGQKLNVKVSLFGRLPSQPYYIEVMECDDERMFLRSSEKGPGVKSWLHTLTVSKTSDGSRLTDVIEIDAGMLTPILALWAKYLYAARHKPRLELLASRKF